MTRATLKEALYVFGPFIALGAVAGYAIKGWVG